MSRTSRSLSAAVVLLVLAAPVAGWCASLLEPAVPCAMAPAPEMTDCDDRADAVLEGCCSLAGVSLPADAILLRFDEDAEETAETVAEPLAAVAAGFVSAGQIRALNADPPPVVPVYILHAAFLL